MIIALDSAPATLDPHLQDDWISWTVLYHIFEPLVNLNSNMNVTPRLAERWETVDELTWRFFIRQDVQFQDGRPLRSEDVVASIRRALNHPRSEISSLILEINSVEKVGDWTVEIVTRQPYPILLNKLSFVLIVPQDAPSVIEVPVGTGPYRVENQGENRIEVRKFHDYWDSVPQIDTVIFSFIENSQDRLDSYFRGEAHLVYGALEADLARYPKRTDYQLLSETSVYISYLQFRVDRPPFNNPLVRQAFNLAIDRHRLAGETASHNVRPASHFLSPQVFGFVPDLPVVEADPEKARALLVEAGYSEDIEWEAYFLGRPVEKALETQLAEVGIHIKPVFLERSVLFQKLERNEVDLLRSSWGCPGGDASEFFDNVVHTVDPTNSYGEANTSGYSNLLLDSLIESAGRTFNVVERRGIFARATSVLLEDMPLIPLLMGDDTYVTSTDLVWTPRLDRLVLAQEMHWR